MCGIAGSINHSLDIPLLTKQMFHRGPDEQTTFEDRNLQLHHHRLSILTWMYERSITLSAKPILTPKLFCRHMPKLAPTV
jgi:hypothetical protein